MPRYTQQVRIELGFELEIEFPAETDPDPWAFDAELPDGLVLPDGVEVEDIVVWQINDENGAPVSER